MSARRTTMNPHATRTRRAAVTLIAHAALVAALALGVTVDRASAQSVGDQPAASEMAAIRAEMQALRADLAETRAQLEQAKAALADVKGALGDDKLLDRMREWNDARREFESSRIATTRERARLDYERTQLRQTAYREQQRIAVEDAARPAAPQPGDAVVVRPDNNVARPGFAADDNALAGVGQPRNYSTPYGNNGSPLGIHNLGSLYNGGYGYYNTPYSYGGYGTTVYSPGYQFFTGRIGPVYDYYPSSGRYEYVTPYRAGTSVGSHSHSGSTINISGGYQGDKFKLNFNIGGGSSTSRTIRSNTLP
ncbi:MAG: hypothetical protein GC159_05965 [Phycisphaera sp.]|nr:hypothetical protein [Phycisphaera sp.]